MAPYNIASPHLAPLFEDTARQALYQASKGVPRNVNKLALAALRLAAERKLSTVNEAILLDSEACYQLLFGTGRCVYRIPCRLENEYVQIFTIAVPAGGRSGIDLDGFHVENRTVQGKNSAGMFTEQSSVVTVCSRLQGRVFHARTCQSANLYRARSRSAGH